MPQNISNVGEFLEAQEKSQDPSLSNFARQLLDCVDDSERALQIGGNRSLLMRLFTEYANRQKQNTLFWGFRNKMAELLMEDEDIGDFAAKDSSSLGLNKSMDSKLTDEKLQMLARGIDDRANVKRFSNLT